MTAYNYLYKVDDDEVSVMLYEVQNKRMIIVNSKDRSELELKDSQNNEFVRNNNLEKNIYYASLVNKQDNYVITVNEKEFLLDISKTEEEYIRDELEKYKWGR